MDRQKIGVIVGGIFTGFVVALLLWLNFIAKAEVPQKSVLPAATRPLILCAGVPEQARHSIERARSFLAPHGCLLDATTNGFCENLCQVSPDRAVPCRIGSVLVSLRDGSFSEDHAGETVSEVDSTTRQILWATILLPEKIFAPEGQSLPKDAYAITVAHELGHACGFGHTRTHIIGSFYSEKSGELMNASLLKSGWGVEGLP